MIVLIVAVFAYVGIEIYRIEKRYKQELKKIEAEKERTEQMHKEYTETLQALVDVVRMAQPEAK